MRRLIPYGLVCLMVGCTGPRVGDVVTLRSPAATLYLDRPLFETAAQLAEAGSARSGLNADQDWKRYTTLHTGNQVRIVECVPGGYKVVVEKVTGWRPGESVKGEDVGKVGWMLARDLERK